MVAHRRDRRAVDLSNHHSPRMLAMLAEVLFRSGRRDEAIATAELARQLMTDRDVEWLTADELDAQRERYRGSRR